MADRFSEAFGSIVFYNGHEKWLWELADKLAELDDKKNFLCPFTYKEWGTEEHVLWMMLVSAFGDWGTSIRSGFIEKPKEAAQFINEATERYAEWRIDNG